MMMLLGNISTVQFLHCKALLLSMWWKHGESKYWRFTTQHDFSCDCNLHFNFNERLFSQSHHSEKKQVVSHLSSQPKGKVLFWLLVAEKGLKKPIQSHTFYYITNPSTDSYSIWSPLYNYWLAMITPGTFHFS